MRYTSPISRIDALADRAHALQVELAKAEAEGNSLTIETAELTAQVKAAQAAARDAQDAAGDNWIVVAITVAVVIAALALLWGIWWLWWRLPQRQSYPALSCTMPIKADRLRCDAPRHVDRAQAEAHAPGRDRRYGIFAHCRGCSIARKPNTRTDPKRAEETT